MRKIAKTDHNHISLVKDLLKLGGTGFSMHQLGHGIPDYCYGFRGKNYLIEIKNPNNPPSKQKLTMDQLIFHKTWAGEILVVKTIDDFLSIL